MHTWCRMQPKFKSSVSNEFFYPDHAAYRSYRSQDRYHSVHCKLLCPMRSALCATPSDEATPSEAKLFCPMWNVYVNINHPVNICWWLSQWTPNTTEGEWFPHASPASSSTHWLENDLPSLTMISRKRLGPGRKQPYVNLGPSGLFHQFFAGAFCLLSAQYDFSCTTIPCLLYCKQFR